MSNITDMVLTTCGLEDDTSVEALNAWCRAPDDPGDKHPRTTGEFVRLDRQSGGRWASQMPTWLGHFNYLDDEEFARAFCAVAWEFPDDVRLLVKGEHETAARMLTLAELRADPASIVPRAVR